MNITMDELSLKKVKFGAEPASSQTETETQAPVESNPEKGMNALTFMGIKNLMSNPKLAQEVGVPAEEPKSEPNADAKSYVAPYSSNIAFQGRFSAAKNLLTKPEAQAAALVAATTLLAPLTGCIEEPPQRTDRPAEPINIYFESSTSTIVNVNLDLNALMDLVNKLGETNDLIASFMNQNKDQYNNFIDMLNYLITLQKASSEEDALFHNTVVKFLNEYQTLLKALVMEANKGNANLEKLSAKLDLILNSNLSAEEKLALLVGLMTNANKLLETLVDLNKNSNKYLQLLLEEAKKGNQSLSNIEKYAPEFKKAMDAQLMQLQMLNAKLEILDLDMNANFAELAKQLGMDANELKELLRGIGMNVDDIANKSIKEILEQLQLTNKVLSSTYNVVLAIFNKMNAGNLTEKEMLALLKYMAGLLESIDTNVGDIKNALFQYFPQFKNQINEIIENQGKGLVILNLLKKGQENGMTREQGEMILNFLADFKGDYDKLARLLCTINQNVIEGFNMTNSQLKAILNAIKLVEGQISNMSFPDYTNMIKELLAVAQNCKDLLTDINIKTGLLEQGQKVIIEEIKKLSAKVLTPEDLAKLEAYLETLVNNPEFDDAAILAKLDDMLQKLLEHEYCQCNCGGGSGCGEGEHEGIIGELIN